MVSRLARLIRGLRERSSDRSAMAVASLLGESWARRLRSAASLAYEIPFWDPAARWRFLRPELDQEIDRAFGLRSTAEIDEFLESFGTEYGGSLGLPYGVGVSSGTASLTFGLLALGLQPGDEVILPSFTYVGSALAVCNAGCVPLFADVGPDGQLDLREIARRRRPKTRAVMVVHLFGSMGDPGPLVEYCRRENLFLVEDACQAHGVSWQGRAAGSFGDVAAFSFNYTKLLSGPGNGGILVTRRSGVARRARLLRDPESPDPFVLQSRRTPAYLDPVQAACVRASLTALGRILEHHARLAEAYRRGLSGVPVQILGAQAGAPNSWYRLVVRTPERDRLRDYLNERGVEARVCYATPTSRLAPFRATSDIGHDLPETERLCRETLALPIGVHLDTAAAERAASHVTAFFRGSCAR